MVETTFRSGRMNERIDELMIEAGARFEFLHGVHYDDFQYKKFAELIVKECISVINTEAAVDHIEGEYERMWKMGTDFAVDQIEKHFGVEE